MARNYACDRCNGACYSKGLKKYRVNGVDMWLCKDCRVKLGFEKYDEYKYPDWITKGW